MFAHDSVFEGERHGGMILPVTSCCKFYLHMYNNNIIIIYFRQ